MHVHQKGNAWPGSQVLGLCLDLLTTLSRHGFGDDSSGDARRIVDGGSRHVPDLSHAVPETQMQHRMRTLRMRKMLDTMPASGLGQMPGLQGEVGRTTCQVERSNADPDEYVENPVRRRVSLERNRGRL